MSPQDRVKTTGVKTIGVKTIGVKTIGRTQNGYSIPIDVPPGSLAAPDHAAAVKPSFTLPGDHRLQPVAAGQGQAPGPVKVTISTENSAPLARPGAAARPTALSVLPIAAVASA